jgi:hypothetical protein
MRLLLSQKNDLFDYIETIGLSPNLFEFNEPKSMDSGKTIIRFKNSPFHCAFFMHPDKNVVIITCSPSEDLYEKQDWIDTAWPSLKLKITGWLRYLQREIQQVDKWARLAQEVSRINIPSNDDNDKFTASEYAEIKIKMSRFKSELKYIDLTPLQIEILEQKIDYLMDKAETLGKFDWKSLFIGTIISIIIQLGVTPDNAQAFWDLIKRIFNQFLLP